MEVRKLSDGRARRHKEAIQGTWTDKEADKWKWLQVPTAPPISSLTDEQGTLFADVANSDRLVRRVWDPISNRHTGHED